MRSVNQLVNFVRAAEVAQRLPAHNYLILNDHGRVTSTHRGSGRDEKSVNQHLIGRIFGRCCDRISDIALSCSQWLWGVNSVHRVENRLVWEAFLRCLRHVYGQAKVDRICKRYRVDFNELYLQGAPLLPKYVKMVSIGAQRILTSDLSRKSFQSLDALTTKEIQKRIAKHAPISPMGRALKPVNIYGAPIHKSAWFRYHPMLMDKELFYLCSDVKEMTLKKWLERFSKCTVNKELMEKQIIPAPGGNGSINYYQVYRKIACNGLIAYGLRPMGSDARVPPLVIFRPTQFALSGEDSLETFMNDFQINIGEWGYSSAREELAALIRDRSFCPLGTRAIIAGYSLGGAFAQRFMVDHWKKIARAFFFNSPSVEEELAEQFANKVNASSIDGDPIQITILRSIAGEEGDVAHIVGGKHLGWGIEHPRFEIKLTEYNYLKRFVSTIGDRIWLHSRRVLDNDHNHFKPSRVSQRKLNKHLDNESRGPMIFWYEKTRRVWGSTIYWILYAIRNFLKPAGILRTAHQDASQLLYGNKRP